MDLTRPVEYRGLQLNDAATQPNGPIVGIQLDTADYSEVPAVGYSEKRSAGDGFDSSDVFLGARRVVLAGTVYGADRADLFDRLQSLRLAFSPTSAYADSPGTFGYIPLDFDVPTNDIAFPSGFIAQCLRVRPSRMPSWAIRRDQIGGVTDNGLAVQWQAALDAKDPRVYAQVQQDFATWVGRTSGSGTFTNKGDYPAPLDILLFAPAGAAAATLDLVIAGSNMHLKMPTNATKPQILRYDGGEKVVRLQVDTTITLRMDLLSFTAGTTHPLIKPGSNPFTYARGVAIGAGSHMWFWESWA